MKIITLALSLTFMVNGAFGATPQKYSCDSVDGIDEWTIYVDLEKNLAGFFDNDTTTKAQLTDTRYLESMPPQWEYVFESRESDRNGRIRIVFNQTKLSAYVIENPGEKDARTYRSQSGCSLNPDIDLED